MEDKIDKMRWWILITVIVGTFLGRLDQTIVSLAIPQIMDDFSITISAAGWIATAYILANAIFVPIWGKLGDTIGRKKVYIMGFLIFIAGSILAGLSWNLNSMIVFRVIQAIAGSADYPTAMAIIAVTFRQGRERAMALGIWSTSFAAAAVLGPLIGGPLIDNFGWRSVFLINLPIGIIGIIMATVFIKESVSEKKTIKFDWWGAITLGMALSALVLVLDKGRDWGWSSGNSLIAYASVIVFGIIFYFIDKNHPDPIVDFKMFKNSVVVGALTNNFVVFMGLMGSIFLIPVFLQTYLGYSATQAGYIFMPMAFMMVISSFMGGKLVGRVKSQHVITISTFVAAIGLFLFIRLDPRSSAWDVVIPISVMAFGLGLGMAQRTSIIASSVPENEVGSASSVLALVRNIAGAFGIAIFATILDKSIERHVTSLAANTIINSSSPLIHAQVMYLIILKAQILAYKEVFLISALIVLAGAIIALFLKSKNGKGKTMMVLD
jgi:DHA2 family multidrug resistance protein